MTTRFAPVPTWVTRDHTLSQGAKVCFGRLRAYKGRNPEAYPRQDQLSAELGVSDRQVRRYLTELRRRGLLEWRQRGLTRSNAYVPAPDPEPPSMSGPDRTYMSGPIEKNTLVCCKNTHSEPDRGHSRRQGHRGPDPPERLLVAWAELESRQPTRAWVARHRPIAEAFLAEFPSAARNWLDFLRWAWREDTGRGRTETPQGWAHAYPRFRAEVEATARRAEAERRYEERRRELQEQADDPEFLEIASLPRGLQEIVRRRGLLVVDEEAPLRTIRGGEQRSLALVKEEA